MRHVQIIARPDARQLEQLPALLERAAVADGHEAIGEHKFLRLQQGDDDAAAITAFSDGRLLGYAHTLAYRSEGGAWRVSCEFVVHPDARQHGVGELLVEAAAEYARTKGARRIDVWAYNDAPGGNKILRDAGFVPSRRLLHLHRHVRDTVAVPAPRGMHVRGFDPGSDEESLLRLNNEIFAGHPEQGSWTLSDIRARMAQAWFNPDDVLMLDVDGRPGGFCWLKVEERGIEGLVGEVYVIGTVPSVRGRGAGRYLLRQALRRLSDRKVRVAAMYVDESNERAISLYQSCGFHYHHVDVCYSMDLAAERPVGERVEAAA